MIGNLHNRSPLNNFGVVALSNIADVQVIDETDAATNAAKMNNFLSPDNSVGSSEESLELSDMTNHSTLSAAASEKNPDVVIPVNLVAVVVDHGLKQNLVTTTAVGTTSIIDTEADANLAAVAILLEKKELLVELISYIEKFIDVSRTGVERKKLVRTLKEHQKNLDNINKRLTNNTMCTTPKNNLHFSCDESLVSGNNNDAGVFFGNDFLNDGVDMFFDDYCDINSISLDAEFGHDNNPCDASFESSEQFWNREESVSQSICAEYKQQQPASKSKKRKMSYAEYKPQQTSSKSNKRK